LFDSGSRGADDIFALSIYITYLLVIWKGDLMFRIRTLVLVLGVLVLLSPSLSAGTNEWARNYPRRTKTGDILIKGTATPDSGFTLNNTGTGNAGGTAVVWPAGRKGGNTITFTFDINADGTWSTTLTGMGLDPKVRYVVVVQVSESMTTGCGACAVTTTNNIATEPRVATRDDDDQGDDD
jgi:hypothetical protein